MKRFLAFVKKEFFHILRDRRTLLILFGLPFVQVLLFGFALSNEIKNANIAILDNDKSLHTQQITARLLSSGYFQVYQNLSSYKEIDQTFRKGVIKMVVVFPAQFSYDYEHGRTAQIQIIADASEQNTAISLTNYASAIIQGYTTSVAGSIAPMYIDVNTQMVFNPELKGAFVFVPGVMTLVLLLVSAMMTSVTIAREKEMGTMEVLFVSPLSQWQIILGKVIPYLALSFVNGCVILILGVFLLELPMNGNLLLLLLETLLFIFLALSIGVFISSLTDSQLVAMFASMVIMLLPTIFLSGFIFPIESMPKGLQVISNIIPAKYFIRIVKNIMIKGIGVRAIALDTLILAVMALFFIGLSIRNLKTHLA
ncbi:ABC transporter permease [Xanthocytophaga agilis]|uniref:Transport permease protein n=1 Tax=Xanthocytophaga agilis TaxID=3048010 RepID=A0AAE3UAY1_9BACT|nr:ABC transporter permease [Xanthocytophaga agilis]MDJ1499213.1 ABC transporter permease [Xanthocytophaga agilis]